MRWRISTPFALALLTPAALVAADFRGSSWGDSMEAVRATETATFHHRRADEMAFIDRSIEGIEGGIIYLFERDALVRGVYVARHDYPGGENAEEHFRLMSEHLDELLGDGGELRERWFDESLRGAAGRLGEAVAGEQVRVSRVWTSDNTHVELVMTGRDGGVFLRALFQPRR